MATPGLNLKLNGRKPTVRDLATAAEEARPSPPRRLAALATPAATAPIDPLDPAGGRCRCNPEVAVGILAAFVPPAAARLRRVAQPVRAGARGILEATPFYRRWPPFRVAEFMLACNLCCHQLGGGHLFMYKGEMAFCSPECRHEYYVEELHRERWRRASMMPARRRLIRRRDDAAGEEQSIFFICADNL